MSKMDLIVKGIGVVKKAWSDKKVRLGATVVLSAIGGTIVDRAIGKLINTEDDDILETEVETDFAEVDEAPVEEAEEAEPAE